MASSPIARTASASGVDGAASRASVGSSSAWSSTSRGRDGAATGRAAADVAATRAGTKSVMIRSQWYDRRRAPMTAKRRVDV